jgi:hypothetical protein
MLAAAQQRPIMSDCHPFYPAPFGVQDADVMAMYNKWLEEGEVISLLYGM